MRKDKQGFAHSGSFGKRMQDLEMALGSALVGGKNGSGVLGEFFGNHGVECAADGGGDFLAVEGKQGSLGGVKVLDEGLEIFHVGAENQRFICQNGFGRVLTAGGKE